MLGRCESDGSFGGKISGRLTRIIDLPIFSDSLRLQERPLTDTAEDSFPCVSLSGQILTALRAGASRVENASAKSSTRAPFARAAAVKDGKR